MADQPGSDALVELHEDLVMDRVQDGRDGRLTVTLAKAARVSLDAHRDIWLMFRRSSEAAQMKLLPFYSTCRRSKVSPWRSIIGGHAPCGLPCTLNSDTRMPDRPEK